MRHVWVLPILLSLLAGSGGAESLEAEGALRAVTMTSPAPFVLSVKALEVVKSPPDGVVAAGLLDPVYASHVIAGRTVHVVLGRSSEEAVVPDVLGVDRDGDGRFAPGERRTFSPMRRDDLAGGSYPRASVRVGDDEYAFDVFYRKRGDEDPRIGIRATWFLQGVVQIGDDALVVAVRDGDLDGTFAGENDHWTVRLETGVLRPLSAVALSARDEGRHLSGRRVRLLAVEGRRMRLEVEARELPDPEDLARARERIERLWRERLEPSREKFAERALVDPGRPKAANPVRWRRVTFSRALEIARAERFPLFVELRSFEAAGCYRLDMHTYVDEEVVKLLNQKFVPLQIIREQDTAGEFVRLLRVVGGGPLPAIGVWSADGKVLHRVSGFRKPRDLVFELGAALETIEKQRAKEAEKDGDR